MILREKPSVMRSRRLVILLRLGGVRGSARGLRVEEIRLSRQVIIVDNGAVSTLNTVTITATLRNINATVVVWEHLWRITVAIT